MVRGEADEGISASKAVKDMFASTDCVTRLLGCRAGGGCYRRRRRRVANHATTAVSMCLQVNIVGGVGGGCEIGGGGGSGVTVGGRRSCAGMGERLELELNCQ